MASMSPRKKAAVTFAGSDDVAPQHSRRERLSRNCKENQVPGADAGSDSSCQDDDTDPSATTEEVFKPSQALSEDQGLAGKDVYGFKSMKRATRLADAVSRAVSAAATPTTPSKQKRGSVSSAPVTPKSILKNSRGNTPVLVETGQTPVSRRATKRTQRLAATTPHRLRARQTAGGSSSDDSGGSDSDSSDSDSESSEESEDELTPKQVKKLEQKPASDATPSRVSGTANRRRGRGRTADVDDTVKADAVEAYFDAHHRGEVLTSDRTLARLNTPRMDHQALTDVLGGVECGFHEDRLTLLQDNRSYFQRWMFLMCHDYNILLHGLGSKRSLLEEFRALYLEDFNHVVVNGYFPSLTVKSILNSITEEILEYDGSYRNPIEQYDFIRKHYECGEKEDFFLIIHNIDGSVLRGEKAQTILSLLAQIRGFHILASIDHLNAPLLWDQTKCGRYNWLWYDITTYESYTEETSYENSLLVQQSGVLALSSLSHVMHSLTPNARGIFMLLVRHQLEHGKDNSNYQGLPFPDLYQKCREAFLVNSDLTLRTQLTEFKDHKLIKLKKGADGMEYLNIPLDDTTLKEFVEQQEAEET